MRGTDGRTDTPSYRDPKRNRFPKHAFVKVESTICLFFLSLTKNNQGEYQNKRKNNSSLPSSTNEERWTEIDPSVSFSFLSEASLDESVNVA